MKQDNTFETQARAQLEQYILQRVAADPESLRYVVGLFRPIRVKKGDILLNFNEVCRSCYFTLKGGLQIFYVDKSGDPAIRDFVFEGTFVTQLQSFANQTPSPECIQALSACELLAIGRDTFYQLVQQVPQFGEIYRRNLELSYTRSVERVASFVSLDAAERVEWLLANQPYLLQRVPNRVVASYLGIAPATFSRLLSRLSKS
jgi:CRP-like cAMP-binding protein